MFRVKNACARCVTTGKRRRSGGERPVNEAGAANDRLGSRGCDARGTSGLVVYAGGGLRCCCSVLLPLSLPMPLILPPPKRLRRRARGRACVRAFRCAFVCARARLFTRRRRVCARPPRTAREPYDDLIDSGGARECPWTDGECCCCGRRTVVAATDRPTSTARTACTFPDGLQMRLRGRDLRTFRQSVFRRFSSIRVLEVEKSDKPSG